MRLGKGSKKLLTIRAIICMIEGNGGFEWLSYFLLS